MREAGRPTGGATRPADRRGQTGQLARALGRRVEPCRMGTRPGPAAVTPPPNRAKASSRFFGRRPFPAALAWAQMAAVASPRSAAAGTLRVAIEGAPCPSARALAGEIERRAAPLLGAHPDLALAIAPQLAGLAQARGHHGTRQGRGRAHGLNGCNAGIPEG